MKTEILDAVEEKPLVIVRLTTSGYMTPRGLCFKKEITFLKRKCKGFNFVEEDANNVGADETLSRITNLMKLKDGIYQIVTVNEKRDYETGIIDDYDFELINP